MTMMRACYGCFVENNECVTTLVLNHHERVTILRNHLGRVDEDSRKMSPRDKDYELPDVFSFRRNDPKRLSISYPLILTVFYLLFSFSYVFLTFFPGSSFLSFFALSSRFTFVFLNIPCCIFFLLNSLPVSAFRSRFIFGKKRVTTYGRSK